MGRAAINIEFKCPPQFEANVFQLIERFAIEIGEELTDATVTLTVGPDPVREAVLAVLAASAPFSSAWEFDEKADGEDLHDALLAALGMSREDWRALRDAAGG